MIGNLLHLSENDLQQAIEDPDQIQALLFPVARTAEHDERHLEIPQVWHILHFLLTGSEWDGEGVLAKVILGGTQISDEDVGYRPAYYLRPAEVKEVALVLQEIAGEQLWSAMSPDALREARLYAIHADAVDQLKPEALSWLERIRIFYHRAAESGYAVVKYLT